MNPGNMAHGINGFHHNNVASSSSNPYPDLVNGGPNMFNHNISQQRHHHHQQTPPQQILPLGHTQWNGPIRQNSLPQLPIPSAPQNHPFNQQAWTNVNVNQLLPQQFPNGMGPLGGFNVPFFPPQMMQDPFNAPTPVEPGEEKIILQTLVESRNRRETYKDALNSLHGKNGHSASQWKDYYLDNKDRLDETISVYLNPPKVALQAIKKPSPDMFKVEPSPARSLPSNRSASVQRHPPQPAAGKRNTINSLTAPAPVFGDRLPAPNAEIRIPDPPSRSPSPPTIVIPHSRGNKFTPEDRDFFLKFIAWRLKGDPTLTRNDLCALLAEKAPHHTAQSWASYWSNKHDVPDKILAAAKGDELDSDSSESEQEEKKRPMKARPKYKDSSSEEEDEDDDDDALSELESDGDDHAPIKVMSESDMGLRGGPFTDADLYITAKYTLTMPNFHDAPVKDRWQPYSERYPQRSAKSWGEYYRRNEDAIFKLARRMKKQGHLSGESSIRTQRARPSWACSDLNDSNQAKRKHSADLDADGEDDEEVSPNRTKRGRGGEA